MAEEDQPEYQLFDPIPLPEWDEGEECNDPTVFAEGLPPAHRGLFEGIEFGESELEVSVLSGIVLCATREMLQTEIAGLNPGCGLMRLHAKAGSDLKGILGYKWLENTIPDSIVLHLSGRFRLGERSLDEILVMIGIRPMKGELAFMLRSAGKSVVPIDNEFDEYANPDHMPDAPDDLVTGEKLFYVDLPREQLHEFCCDGDVSWKTKLLTVFFVRMPAARGAVAQMATAIPSPGQYAPNTTGKQVEIIDGLYLLLLGYSQQENLGRQVAGRINAAAASMGAEEVTVENVTDAMGLYQVSVSTSPGPIFDVIGNTVSLDYQGDGDPALPTDESMGARAAGNFFGMTPWAMAMYEQMRMVYLNKKGTTVRMGAVILELARSICHQMKGVWLAEWNRLNAQCMTLATCGYISCQNVLPDNLRIAKFPRLCYMGLLYHKQNLKDDAERETFSKYAVAAIAGHITNQSERNTCEYIVRIWPSVLISTLARIAEFMPVDNLDDEYAQLTEVQQLALMKELKRIGSTSPWYRLKREAREAAVRAQMRERAIRDLRERLRESVAAARAQAHLEANHDRRNQVLMDINDWERACLEKLDAQVSLEEMVGRPDRADDNDLRMTLLESLRDIYNRVVAGFRPAGQQAPDEDID